MSALIVIVVLGVWGALLYNFGYYASFAVQRKWVRQLIGAVTTACLFTLPINDEIAGAKEFEALCKLGGGYQIAPNAVGKKFDLKYSSTKFKPMQGFARPVEEKIISYTDVSSGEIGATAKAYQAKGGWLVQRGWLRNSGGGDGAFLGRDQCFPGAIPGEALRLKAITNKIID